MSDSSQSPGHAGSRVAIVTDSTTYLPRELLDRLGVRRVSLYVGWDGELLSEPDYQDLDAFYARLQESASLPSTSQPSVGDFLEVYRPLAAQGVDVASIHIAEGLSGTCASARSAARVIAEEGHPGRVAVHDAATGAGGLGCLVLAAAARSSCSGASLEDVLAELRRARGTLDIWFCLDTLEYLRRGGRIGAAQALVGMALQMKPILTFGTEIAPAGRVRTHRRAMERMVLHMRELEQRGAGEWVVQHAQSAADAEQLVARGREVFGSEPLFCTEVGPVLGAHLGAGVLVGGLDAPGVRALLG